MESKLVKLKSDFNEIINIRNTVKNVFDILQVRIDRLRQIYSEFIKTNKTEMFVFGLDSFHFQSKLIDIEYYDMKRLFLAINNRMYCEYFKLHKIIVEYISKNINDKKISDLVKVNNYPIYKDIEPFKEYKFETILDIHENILNLLGILMSILNNKENELSIHKTKQNIGLNIDNFITSFNFNISVMREKIMMFITYIEFFHKMHSTYLKRFSNKIQLMYTHISNDIKFDDSIEISKNKKKELIDDFLTNNMDKQLIKELKISIGSETNSDISSEESKSSEASPKEKISDKYEKKLSINILPEIDNSTRSISNSFLNLNTTTTGEKKNRKIFQKNVHKVTDVLSLCKPKNNKVINPKLSDKDIQEMFCGIEESCNLIINETISKKIDTNGNIELYIDSHDDKNIVDKLCSPLKFEENIFLDEKNEENNIKENIVKTEIFTFNESIHDKTV